jgi:archaellum component FlaC
MSKRIVVSKDEKQTILEMYNQDKTQVDEQLGGFLKSIGKYAKELHSPEVALGARREVKDIVSNASSTVKNLMTKFGIVKNTPFIQELMRPLDNELAIIKNDVKRLEAMKSQIPQDIDWLKAMSEDVDRITNQIKNPGGGYQHFDWLYQNVSDLDRYVNYMIEKKALNPQGIQYLATMDKNLKDSLKHIEDALVKIATKK